MDNMDSKTGNKSELFEQISDEYSMLLLNWAHKKTGSRTEAEDLAQEVLTQIFRSAQKEQHIEKLDNFIWKIAHFVWCNYLKKNIVLRACIPIDSFDYDFLSEKDHAEKYAEQEELNDKIKKMRSKIANLNYLQREIMIMHYIDELPIKSIAKKLNITEANVKWHLYDTRKKLKKEINEMNNTNYVYRPGKLHMAVSGNPGPAPAIYKIKESLTKQNICLVCYREAKTSTEIAELLGIAKAYVEFDLEWLVDKQFMKQENGKYSTMFSIEGQDFSAKVANLYLRNKENFSDVIINKFIEKQDKIKNIGFYGSDQPIEKLLWFFIYRFINYAGNQVTYIENKYPPVKRPIMPDGGQYFPLGIDKSEAQNITEEFLNEKYKAIHSWDANGAMCNPNDDITLYWMGLCQAGAHTLEMLFESSNPSPNYNTFKFFCDTFKKEFNLNYINENEKDILSKMISNGWVSKKDNKIIYNFSVFTHEQNKALENIFGEIYGEMKNEIYKMFAELEKLCRADLPKHLEYYTNYHLYMAFQYAIQSTTGFGFYDGKIYEPKDAVECGLLTFHVITGKPEKSIRTDKITVNGKEYNASYFGEQDLAHLNWESIKREFWRLENAYDDFKDRGKTGDVLPYNNYPMAIEIGQVFVIDYTNKDDSVKRTYYRSDGYIWHEMASTEEFRVE